MSDSSFVVLTFVSWPLPNLLIAWAYTTFVGGHSRDFWIAFGVLVVVRLVFSSFDVLVNLLTWKLYRKRFVVDAIVKDFRRFNFPKRDPDEDWLEYLSRIQGTESLPFGTRRAAAFMEGQMDIQDKSGIAQGVQSESALKAAIKMWTNDGRNTGSA
jgi:hypothetical protein